MGTRGRISAAALSVITPEGVVALRRPEPPEELTEEQAEEWRAIVNRLPADWFPRETHPLLAAYCRHVIAARRVAQLIKHNEGGENFSIADYDRLLKCQERESRAVASLSVKMRISQSTTYDKSKKKPATNHRPWDAGNSVD